MIFRFLTQTVLSLFLSGLTLTSLMAAPYEGAAIARFAYSHFVASNETIKEIKAFCELGNYLTAYDIALKTFPSESITLEDLVKIDIGPDDAKKKEIEESKRSVNELSQEDKIILHRCLAQIAIARNDETEALRHLRAIRQINPKFQLTASDAPLAAQVSPKLNKLYGTTKAAPSFGSLALSILGFGAVAALATQETSGSKLTPKSMTLSISNADLVAHDLSETADQYLSETGAVLPTRATLTVTIVNPISDSVTITLSGLIFKNSPEAGRPQISGTLKRAFPTTGNQFSKAEFQVTGLGSATLSLTSGSVSGVLTITAEHGGIVQTLSVQVNPRELSDVVLDLSDVTSITASAPLNDPNPYLNIVNQVERLNNEQVIAGTNRGVSVTPIDKFGNRLSRLPTNVNTSLVLDGSLPGGFYIERFVSSYAPEILDSNNVRVLIVANLQTPSLFDANPNDNSDLPYLIFAREVRFTDPGTASYVGVIGDFQRELRFNISPDIVGRIDVAEWSLNLNASVLGVDSSTAQIVLAPAGRLGSSESAREESLRQPLVLTVIENGVPYQRLTKSLQGRQVEWELEARADQPHQQVRLTWDRLNQIPRRYSLMLIDLETNQRQLLRSSSGYSFNMGENKTRRFKIVANLSPQTRLMMTGVAAQPSRGGQMTLNFNLSKPAMVQARVRTMSGRDMGVLMPSRAVGAGTNMLPLTTPSMNRAPAGVYMLELEAQTDDGERARQVVPWVITR